MPSIHIFGINYWPEETGIAPYTTLVAEHLARRGDRVRVTTGVQHYPEWSRPISYPRRLRMRERRTGVEVVRLQHHVPRSQSSLRRAAYEASFGLHSLTRVAVRSDVVVGVIPALSGGLAAAISARLHGAPLVLVTQDLMGPATAQSGITGGDRLTPLVTAIERRVLARAAAIVVPSESFIPYLTSVGVERRRVHRIPNWSHVARPSGNRWETRHRLGWGPEETILLHAGNMGFKQDLESVVALARRAESAAPSLRFVLMGDGNRREALVAAACGASNVEIRPPEPTESFTDVLAAADVLLLHQRTSVADMAFPSKLTSYFAAGRPVLAAVGADSEIASELKRSGAGRVVAPEDLSALLTAVKQMLAGEADRLGRAGQRYAEEHLSEEAALARYAAVLDSVVPGQER